MQAIVDPLEVFRAINFMQLGKFLDVSTSDTFSESLASAQRLGLAFGLSISGSVFVNEVLRRSEHALPGAPRSQILSAITGTSREFFRSLSREQQRVAADTLTIVLRKV